MVLDQIVNLVIRPPRAEYDPEVDLLGPVFSLKGREYRRQDLQLVNKRGHFLECSHYRLAPGEPDADQPLPCVIYCHGNSGCRADANDAAMVLLPLNVSVLALDFSGSGMSQGEWVSLGKFEVEDLEAAIDYLRTEGLSKKVGLWGRSMGAVTALLYAAKDPTVAGIVVDSPFSNLTNLILELVDYYKIPLPKFSVKMGVVPLMRRSIRQKASFDINELDTVSLAPSTFIPALFAHAKGDTFVQPHHSKLIHDAYAGDKNRITFTGDHNSPRPEFFFDSVSIFLHNVLNPPPVRMRRRAKEHDFGIDLMALREQHLAEKAKREGDASSSSKDQQPEELVNGAGGGDGSSSGAARATSEESTAQSSSTPQDAKERMVQSVEELAASFARCGQDGALEQGGPSVDLGIGDEDFLIDEDESGLRCPCTCRRLHELLHFPSKKLMERQAQQSKKKRKPKRHKGKTGDKSPALSRIASLRIPLIRTNTESEHEASKKDRKHKRSNSRSGPVVPTKTG